MENKQTAVDWLISQLPLRMQNYISKEVQQAKDMERDQIEEAFYVGADRESESHGAMYIDRKDAENYYNEIYGKQTNAS